MKKEVIKEVFYCLSSIMVIFVGMELISPNIVLAYLNVNLVLILWFIAGMIVLVINER